MKWPASLTFIRHGESTYNVLKKIKRSSAFLAFKEQFREELEEARDINWPSDSLREQAMAFWEKLRLGVSDYDTPLTGNGVEQARRTGEELLNYITLPDVIYVSPYLRTRQTLETLQLSAPALQGATVVVEERIREQEHGLQTLYNDKRIAMTLHPAQALLWRQESAYEYRYPNGENKADVRDRLRSFLGTLIREHSAQHILVVSHHLALLSLRANVERWDREQFIEVDHNDKPINCGVTVYKGDPEQGEDGKLVLERYNKKLY